MAFLTAVGSGKKVFLIVVLEVGFFETLFEIARRLVGLMAAEVVLALSFTVGFVDVFLKCLLRKCGVRTLEVGREYLFLELCVGVSSVDLTRDEQRLFHVLPNGGQVR